MRCGRHTTKIFLAAVAVAWITSPCISAQSMKASKVIVIGVGGLTPDGVVNANTPTLDALMERGAHTMGARGVIPTDSSPNWASMITGASPEQHGITSNGWELDDHEIPPVAKGPGGMFPTLFSVLRARHPNQDIGCFYGKGGFVRLIEKDVCTRVEYALGPEKTIESAIKFISERQPMFTFIQFESVDRAGHSSGYVSPEYYAAVEEADLHTGKLIEELGRTRMAENTVVIVTSDHGGKGKAHGGASLAEMEIPWIIAGPSIRKGKITESPVMTWDTAATVTYILGATPPATSIAKPVLEAFEN